MHSYKFGDCRLPLPNEDGKCTPRIPESDKEDHDYCRPFALTVPDTFVDRV